MAIKKFLRTLIKKCERARLSILGRLQRTFILILDSLVLALPKKSVVDKYVDSLRKCGGMVGSRKVLFMMGGFMGRLKWSIRAEQPISASGQILRKRVKAFSTMPTAALKKDTGAMVRDKASLSIPMQWVWPLSALI